MAPLFGNLLRILGGGLGLTALALVGVVGTSDLKKMAGRDELSAAIHVRQPQILRGRVRCEVRPTWRVQDVPDSERACESKQRVP